MSSRETKPRNSYSLISVFFGGCSMTQRALCGRFRRRMTYPNYLGSLPQIQIVLVLSLLYFLVIRTKGPCSVQATHTNYHSSFSKVERRRRFHLDQITDTRIWMDRALSTHGGGGGWNGRALCTSVGRNPVTTITTKRIANARSPSSRSESPHGSSSSCTDSLDFENWVLQEYSRHQQETTPSVVATEPFSACTTNNKGDVQSSYVPTTATASPRGGAGSVIIKTASTAATTESQTQPVLHHDVMPITSACSFYQNTNHADLILNRSSSSLSSSSSTTTTTTTTATTTATSTSTSLKAVARRSISQKEENIPSFTSTSHDYIHDHKNNHNSSHIPSISIQHGLLIRKKSFPDKGEIQTYQKYAKLLKNRNNLNISRKITHATFGVFFAILNNIIPKSTFVPYMTLLTTGTLLMEMLRYRDGFGWMNDALHFFLGSALRKHEMEGKFTGSFYYFLGVTLTSYLYPTNCASLGICQLALADPAASYFGRMTRHVYWSRIENGFLGIGRNKGFLGFLGGALFCLPFNYRALSGAQLGTTVIGKTCSGFTIASVSLLLGIAGAFSDLCVPSPALTMPKTIFGFPVPRFHVDDNVVVPIVSGYVCTKLLRYLGWSDIQLLKYIFL